MSLTTIVLVNHVHEDLQCTEAHCKNKNSQNVRPVGFFIMSAIMLTGRLPDFDPVPSPRACLSVDKTENI